LVRGYSISHIHSYIHLNLKYCGSCWAHGALSSLADRIKIARKAQGDDINLSIQFILNCGTEDAGSCHGGYHTQTYEFIQKTGYVPYDTCMPYVACSKEATDGICPYVDTQCSATTTCKTCESLLLFTGTVIICSLCRMVACSEMSLCLIFYLEFYNR